MPKVRGMTQPEQPANDRRSVPRHIRDAEHDMSRDLPAGQETAGRHSRLWIWLAVALALGTGLWFVLSTRP
jgi:hypothetical protein